MVGFTQHEQRVLGVFFKMANRREHTYVTIPNADEADVLLVNADSDIGMKWIKEARPSKQKILLVGKAGMTSSWPTMQRPYALLTVVEQLDSLFHAATAAPTPSPPTKPDPPRVQGQPTARTWFASTQIEQRPALPTAASSIEASPTSASAKAARHSGSVRQGTGTAPVTARSAGSRSASEFLGLGEEVSATKKTDAFDDILVVDDSDVALKFMQKLLTRFGFRAELAISGEDALARTSKRSYRFVFIDVMMDGMDGYQTCRAIKQGRHAGGKAPVVVMLTSRGASLDKMRGSLAGCDAYLTKPLEENALLQTLSKYDEQVQRGFQDTNVGVSETSNWQPLK